MPIASDHPLANVPRLDRHMDRLGIDAVVARSGVNFTYLAGFDYAGTLARHLDLSDSPRGVCVIWPRHGEPILIVNRIAAPRAERDGCIKRILSFDDYSESMWQRVGRTLDELGLSSQRIGVEKSVVSAAHWHELQRALPSAELCDCCQMMDQVRWIKTDAEIARIRDAARRLDEVYLNVFPTVRDGESEAALHARIVGACIEHGANWAHGILNSSRNTVLYGGESDFKFRRGDVIRNDYVFWFKGYPGHQSRSVVIGEPSAKCIRDYDTVLDIYRRTIAMTRPGVCARDIHAFAQHAFDEAGIEGRVAIAGHSVGAWWHQQSPFLVSADQTIIESGMVLAFEPHVNEFHIQDMFLITDEGQENLSPLWNTDEIFVVSG